MPPILVRREQGSIAYRVQPGFQLSYETADTPILPLPGAVVGASVKYRRITDRSHTRSNTSSSVRHASSFTHHNVSAHSPRPLTHLLVKHWGGRVGRLRRPSGIDFTRFPHQPTFLFSTNLHVPYSSIYVLQYVPGIPQQYEVVCTFLTNRPLSTILHVSYVLYVVF